MVNKRPDGTHSIGSFINHSNHLTIQPFNHLTIQPFSHLAIQPFNHSTIQPFFLFFIKMLTYCLKYLTFWLRLLDVRQLGCSFLFGYFQKNKMMAALELNEMVGEKIFQNHF